MESGPHTPTYTPQGVTSQWSGCNASSRKILACTKLLKNVNTLCIIKNKKKQKDLLFCISLFKERGFYIKVSGLIAKTMYNITDWIKINRPHSKTMFVIFVVLLFPAINLENFYSSKFSHRGFFSLNVLSCFCFKSACALYR